MVIQAAKHSFLQAFFFQKLFYPKGVGRYPKVQQYLHQLCIQKSIAIFASAHPHKRLRSGWFINYVIFFRIVMPEGTAAVSQENRRVGLFPEICKFRSKLLHYAFSYDTWTGFVCQNRSSEFHHDHFFHYTNFKPLIFLFPKINFHRFVIIHKLGKFLF